MVAKTNTTVERVGSDVVRVKPIAVKLRKRAVSAVMAKLNPMEKVSRSIISIVVFLGNKTSVRQ